MSEETHDTLFKLGAFTESAVRIVAAGGVSQEFVDRCAAAIARLDEEMDAARRTVASRSTAGSQQAQSGGEAGALPANGVQRVRRRKRGRQDAVPEASHAVSESSESPVLAPERARVTA